ncbi:hypothetical protein OsI_21398 [Oryza sativa Indica Group]|uniref:Peptidase A1 domain-containing protein n=1 Tax=Oryza sativa subsp. indica TaxID=39946 RepID=A2Y8L7_ORYSI|nr:hypothetical protein OsI_21398 [Oryza sativa Indica Group]
MAMACAALVPLLLLLLVVLSGSTSLADHSAVSPHPNVTNWVPLSRPYGPCSSSPAKGRAAPSTVDGMLWSDQHRADYIQWRLSGSVAGVLQPADDVPVSTNYEQQSIEGDLNYGTYYPAPAPMSSKAMNPAATGGGGGGPGVTQTMVLDTASDVTWVQCSPCPTPPCYPQKDVLYDPTKSSSSGVFSCNSPTCTQLGPYANGCTNNNQCQYRVRYPDGTSTAGTYISDLLTITPATAVRSFQFGCSHGVQGSFSFGSSAAGIMALGGGPESLVSQTAATYGRVFSHCFPPPTRRGFFTLGVPRVAAWRYVLTPMLKNPAIPPTFYMVRLEAIAVAGQRIAVPPTVFAAGAALDSRTAITRLPPTAYQALRQAFRDRMAMYQPAPPKGPLDTCYDMAGVRSFALPRITLVFDKNAAVELDPSGVLFQGCLAFTAGPNDQVPGIIGNIQLQTLEVLYNIPAALVGFRHAAC